MERFVLIAKKLRTEESFNGYIHLKAIPGASEELLKKAGLYADRLSLNIEMPTEQGLKLLAADKKQSDVLTPMKYLRNEIIANTEDRKKTKTATLFAPAGQSTQMVIGATPENDWQILKLSDAFYKGMKLKRVYYSVMYPSLPTSVYRRSGRLYLWYVRTDCIRLTGSCVIMAFT
jgi:predicted DNA-binding helix-hairpin-helix protein